MAMTSVTRVLHASALIYDITVKSTVTDTRGLQNTVHYPARSLTLSEPAPLNLLGKHNNATLGIGNKPKASVNF